MSHPPDDFERHFADLLLAEADTVVPAGDGLSRVRARVERRRARLRWLRPTLAVATTAALGVTGLVVFTLTRTDDSVLRSDPNRPPAVGVPTPTPPVVATLTSRPTFPIWPFTSAAQAEAWEPGRGPTAGLLAPEPTALAFASYLGVDGLRVLDSRSEGVGFAVTLGRTFADGNPHGVTVVHVAQLADGDDQPYVVRWAGAYHLALRDLPFATRIRSPYTATAVVPAGQHAVSFALWSADRRAPLAGPTFPTGSVASPPTGTLTFTPTNDTGMLVASEQSGDGISELTAIPVVLPKTATKPPVPTYPVDFVGVTPDGRIAVFNTRSGSVVRFLTAKEPGGGDSEPVLVGRTVYYVHGTGSCSAEIWRVPVGGGKAERAVPARTGSATQLAVSPDGRRLAWVQSNCSGGGDLRTLDQQTGATQDFPMGAPPTVEGKPAWATDDRLAFRYGHSTGGANGYPVLVLDTRTATRIDDARPLTRTTPCDQGRPAYLPDNSLLVVTCEGTRAAVVRYDGSGHRAGTLLDVPGTGARVTDVITSVDVTTDGGAVIFEVSAGGTTQIYRWTGGQPVRIPGTAFSPSW